MSSVIATGVLAALAGVAVTAWLRRLRLRRIAARRRVEQPNSHYAPPIIERQVEHERWAERIDMAQLHPINAAEVEKLLAQVAAAGFDSLSPAGRQFLENLARTHPPAPPSA